MRIKTGDIVKFEDSLYMVMPDDWQPGYIPPKHKWLACLGRIDEMDMTMIPVYDLTHKVEKAREEYIRWVKNNYSQDATVG